MGEMKKGITPEDLEILSNALRKRQESGFDYYEAAKMLYAEYERLLCFVPGDVKTRLSLNAKVLEDLDDSSQDVLDSFLAAYEGRPCRIIIEVIDSEQNQEGR